MKFSFKTNLTLFVLIRVLLCSATVCLFLLGIGPFIANATIRAIGSIAFVVAMCLFTASTVAQHVKDVMASLLNRVLKSAELLAQASSAMTEAAKGLSRNADVMIEFTDMLDGMADVCDAASKEDEKE